MPGAGERPNVLPPLTLEDNYDKLVADLVRLQEYSKSLASRFRGMSERVDESNWYQGEALFFFIQASELVSVVLSFVPGSPLAGRFQYPSIIALVSIKRTLLESLYTLSHLLRARTPAEAELDWLLWDHHRNRKILWVLHKMEARNPERAQLEQQVREGKSKIQAHSAFAAVPEGKVRNDALGGQIDRLASRQESIAELGYNEAFMESLYKESSLFLHQTSVASRLLNGLGTEPSRVDGALQMHMRHIVGVYSLCLDVMFRGYELDEVPEGVTELVSWYTELFKRVGPQDN